MDGPLPLHAEIFDAENNTGARDVEHRHIALLVYHHSQPHNALDAAHAKIQREVAFANGPPDPPCDLLGRLFQGYSVDRIKVWGDRYPAHMRANLQPVIADNIEVGSSWRRDGLQLQASYFWSNSDLGSEPGRSSAADSPSFHDVMPEASSTSVDSPSP